MRLSVLLIDDESSIVHSVSEALRFDGHRVVPCEDGASGLHCLAQESFDLIICDIRLPHADGMTIFRRAREVSPKTDIIFITAFGAVADAVAAVKEGATDYLIKPFRLETLRARVQEIGHARALRQELTSARAAIDGGHVGTSIVGRSPILVKALERVEAFAASDYPVLITGESGTGKELVARLLHERSERAKGPLVAVNCAAFPETLIEAELFGYRRGAFTGATHDREGRFRSADRGILFLDEVAEMPLPTQAKLLRVLQEGSFEPLGTNQSVRVDVRIVSATHRDLRARMADGLFREDLYYRLKVLDVKLPPLRARPGDIPLLVETFLRRISSKDRVHTLSPSALAALTAYPYPGNVRELEHALQQASVLAGEHEIEVHDLPSEITGSPERGGPSALETPDALQPLVEALAAFERQYLLRALSRAKGQRTQAASLLGISRKNLWQKLRRQGLLDA